jgi:hypothetical protein
MHGHLLGEVRVVLAGHSGAKKYMRDAWGLDLSQQDHCIREVVEDQQRWRRVYPMEVDECVAWSGASARLACYKPTLKEKEECRNFGLDKPVVL